MVFGFRPSLGKEGSTL